jgi:choline dehydrogenase
VTASRDDGYDFVVVGAGAAGCVLAARLSEDPACRVLLLEAGPPDRAAAIRIPAALPTLFGTRYDWAFRTVPQPQAGDRAIAWPSGRTLGGSSATNAMIHVRGHPLDYDTWRDAYGCPGWGYADLLPYFRRAEQGRGAGGGLRLSAPRHRHRLTRAWVAAARASGLPANPGLLTADPDGVGFFTLNQRLGRRWSVADAYLRPALRRPNLTVLTGALATLVEFTRGRATGVRYRQGGAERRAAAGREVVLCAGAVGSPQLLLRSGVGPADHLRGHRIEVVADLPAVGTGLQDHPRCTALWRAPGSGRGRAAARWSATVRWWLLRRGPLASNGGEAGAFLRTRAGLPAPDLQLLVCPPPLLQPAGEPPEPAVAVLVTAVAVGSRGRLRLRSADPGDPPAIDPGYLTDPADLEVLVAGVARAREIAGQPPFAGLARGELAPGAGVRDHRQLRAWVRANVVTLHHPTSSCAMGGAQTAVCDPQLRVRGVAGLRVADASVMPAVPRGNTHAPTVALAERAADLIRGNPTFKE